MFITLEGPEGAGKSTQAELLAVSLRAHGLEVAVTREPGGVPAAEAIRSLVLQAAVSRETEALLFLAARAEHVHAVIRPALERGCVVLCDRFNDSTLAYQGYGLGLDLGMLRRFCDFAAAGLQPQLTLLLDLPPETGLGRRFATPPPGGDPAQGVNKMERRDVEFHRRVRAGYLKEAERAPQRIYRVDASGPVRQVQGVIWREVARRLGLRAPDGAEAPP